MNEDKSNSNKPNRTFRRNRGRNNSENGDPKHRFFSRDAEGPKRGFFLFPNLLTSGGLFCGFWSMTEALAGDYVTAAWLIMLAGVFDGLDGKVARLTRTTSAFGVQYDSLADLVSFGVAPALLIYTWALHLVWVPKIGWTIATMMVVCGALRLARYNVEFDPDEKTYMKGLAIPASAGGVTLTVLFFSKMGWVTAEGTSAYPNLILVLVTVLCFLMVSNFKYYSFKGIDLFRRRPFSVLLSIILFILIIRVWPVRTLYLMFFIYMLSGPALYLINWYFKTPGESGEPIIDG